MNIKLFSETTIVIISDDEKKSHTVQSLLQHNGFEAICEVKDNIEQIISLIEQGYRILVFSASLKKEKVKELLKHIKSHRANTNALIAVVMTEDRQKNVFSQTSGTTRYAGANKRADF